MNNRIKLYIQRLNLQHAMFSQIEHEDTIVAIVYKITLPSGEELVLKICTRPAHYFCEFYFLKYFAGILPVPRIIDAVVPEAGLHGAILMDYLPGTLLKISDLTENLVFEAGSLLATIHSNKTAGYGDLTHPHDISNHPAVPFTRKFEEGINECSQHLTSALLKQSRSYYDAHIDHLTSVDGPCMTHRDFRPGNVIVNEDKIMGIIDWAGARGGFAEEDFCPLEFGEWSVNRNIRQSFLNGYSSIRPVPDYHNVMPLLRLSRAIATIGFTVKSGTWNTRDASLYQRNRAFLDEFLIKPF